jgi:hypothetical protein
MGSRRIGADAAFAKAMARSEFGRFYTDEQEQREVRRSLDRGRERREADRQMKEARKSEADAPEPAKVTGKSKPALWKAPSPRHRRSELAEARARLKASAKSRTENDEA